MLFAGRVAKVDHLPLVLFLLAMKNQATGHYILNGKGEGSSSRSFIDLGIEWEYHIEDDVEALHTDGPLRDAVVVLVSDMAPPSLFRGTLACGPQGSRPTISNLLHLTAH